MARRALRRSKWSYTSSWVPKHVHAGFSGWCQGQYVSCISQIYYGRANSATADFNSVFPAGVNVAASFDRRLAYARGQAMGAEHQMKGSDVQLGPVAGPLGRSPESGRNWEGFR